MKFSTNQSVDLFVALSELRGAPVPVKGANGQEEVVFEPYQLAGIVKWNAAKNRDAFKRLVVAHDEVKADMKAELNAFKKATIRAVEAEQDPKLREQKMAKARQDIQDRVDEFNEELRRIGKEEHDVAHLYMMPAKGFYLSTSKIPPTLVSELLPLIDGEPDFDKEEKAK